MHQLLCIFYCREGSVYAANRQQSPQGETYNMDQLSKELFHIADDYYNSLQEASDTAIVYRAIKLFSDQPRIVNRFYL